MVLEQIGMGAGMMKSNGTCRIVNFIDKNPVALNVAFVCAPPSAVKRVVFALRRQRLFSGNHVNDFEEFIEILASSSHQLPFFSESLCVNRLKHGLLIVQVVVRVVPVKVFPHLGNGMKPAQRGRNLARGHVFGFLHTRVNLRLVERIPRHGVAVRGAEGAFACMVRFLIRSRSKGNNNTPRRYFAGYVNDKPVIGRYFNRLFNGHVVSIA